MKFIYATMNISRLNPFKEMLEKGNYSSYQIIDQVAGRQFTGSPRMNTSVWPGQNSVVCIQCEKDEMDDLLKKIKVMNLDIINESERIMAIALPCEEFIYVDESGAER